jgi:response regulator RpfG family c-di-GMP phosphodiesterase
MNMENKNDRKRPLVIVVDDDPDILETLNDILKLHGFDVMTFNEPESALNTFRKGGKCHAVITDIRMPKMTGDELIGQIQKIVPDQHCLVLTGYADRQHLLKVVQAGRLVRILLKPWSNAELVRTLRSIPVTEG